MPRKPHDKADAPGAGSVGADLSNADAPIDPDVEDNLGYELELRGEQLKADLDATREEAARHLETAQRAQAEFDNFRKRMARDHADAVKRAGERIVENLLPVVDNLERAMAHMRGSGAAAEFLAGVEMVLGQLRDVLAREGVTAIDPTGEPFDALTHQAVGQKEDTGVPEGTVVEVYQKGYEMHGRTIRAAMVVVSTGGPHAEE